MGESFFIDAACYQTRKHGEHVCGDAFVSRRIENEGRLVAVLSDGLGSGVKANILASMTATMAIRFAAADQEPLRAAEVMMDSLPVCQVRKISYSTFSILDCRHDLSVRVIEEGNPEFLLARGGNVLSLPRTILESRKWPDRHLAIYDFSIQPEDRLIFCSDGVTQAGIGSKAYPLGWQRAGLVDYVLSQTAETPDLSSRRLSERIVREAIRKDPERIPNDDTSCAVFYVRRPRGLLLWTGPPYTPSADAECARRFDAFVGKKVISGGTTANIVARELGRSIETLFSSQSASVPAESKMDGVDLVTEGVITLAKTAEYLESGRFPSYENGAAALAELLLESDAIHLMVGSSVNTAHLDPTLPVALEFRRTVVQRLVNILRQKYIKQVTIEYI